MKTNQAQETIESNISATPDVRMADSTTKILSDASQSENDELATLRAENEQLRATIRDAAAQRLITGELGRVGARSPELLFAAVKGDLQFADDGSVTNAAAVIGELRQVFPEQFGIIAPPASIDAGAGTAHVPRLSKEALAKMKPAEIAKLDWEDVKRTLSN